MMTAARLLRAVRRHTGGSVAVEFALIGPIMLAMFFGVMQFGIGMQNYNALQSVSDEVARYMVIDAQDAAAHSDMTRRDSNTSLQAYAREVATNPPYGLESGRFNATVTSRPTRIDGTSERQITLTYNVRTYLGVIGFGSFPLTCTRTVFIA